MKLTKEHIDFIEAVVKTGLSINIENIIIEPGAVRAIDENRTVVLYQNTNVPEFPFGSIGLSRTNSFMSRIDLVKARDGFVIDSVVTPETDDAGELYAQILKMTSNDTKITYRCADPKNIQAPKAINDTIIYQVQLNSEAVSMLQRGSAAMGSDIVSVIGSSDGVSFECGDVTGDTFTHQFTSSATLLEGDNQKDFSHNYLVKTVLALFKQNPDGVFEIGSKGILRITINDLQVYILPQV